LFAGERSKSTQPLPHPEIHPEEKLLFDLNIPVAPLSDLLQMKLNAFRPRDLTHLEILDDLGLVTPAIEQGLPAILRERLDEARRQIAAGKPEPRVPPARTVRDRSAPELVCDATLEAMRAVQRRDSSARDAMDRLENLVRSGVAEFFSGDGHLEYASIALARLRDQAGDRTGALAALRYRPYFVGWQPFLAASLRDEGRLAAEVGDRHGAIRAYEHYVALRHASEPESRAPLDSVRAELARLKSTR